MTIAAPVLTASALRTKRRLDARRRQLCPQGGRDAKSAEYYEAEQLEDNATQAIASGQRKMSTRKSA